MIMTLCPDLAERENILFGPRGNRLVCRVARWKAYHCIDIHILQMMIKESDCPEHFYLYDCTRSNSSY